MDMIVTKVTVNNTESDKVRQARVIVALITLLGLREIVYKMLR